MIRYALRTICLKAIKKTGIACSVPNFFFGRAHSCEKMGVFLQYHGRQTGLFFCLSVLIFSVLVQLSSLEVVLVSYWVTPVTPWAYPKSQIDGRNHKNMGVRRAILHKRQFKRAPVAHWYRICS